MCVGFKFKPNPRIKAAVNRSKNTIFNQSFDRSTIMIRTIKTTIALLLNTSITSQCMRRNADGAIQRTGTKRQSINFLPSFAFARLARLQTTKRVRANKSIHKARECALLLQTGGHYAPACDCRGRAPAHPLLCESQLSQTTEQQQIMKEVPPAQKKGRKIGRQNQNRPHLKEPDMRTAVAEAALLARKFIN